jgi:hypothetical protein
MPDETTNIITQNEGERFAVDHDGGVALYGRKEAPALQHHHQFGGEVMHSMPQPLVHMVCWDEEPCAVAVTGRVTLAGDEKAPIQVNHHFANDHHQTLAVEPFAHTMKVATELAEPIHHALQVRTPVELRFCNPWQVDSGYEVEVTLGQIRLLSISLRGSTVLTPQPCAGDEPCAEPGTKPAIRLLPGTV